MNARAYRVWLWAFLVGVCLLGFLVSVTLGRGEAAPRPYPPAMAIPGGRAVPETPLRAYSLHRGSATATDPERTGEEGKRQEQFFKVVNFLLLVGGLAFLARKPLGEFFAQRSASVRKALDEGRKALGASQGQLKTVEEKLRHLEGEIATFKASAVREMEAERQRLRQTSTEEAEKILESARIEIEKATRAAKIELRIYSAQQAVELAEEMIRQRLDDVSRRQLFSRFVDGLVESEELKVER